MLLDRGFEKTGRIHGASCSCPACLGLQCLQRPRYFSGQLLTEADLNSEQEYRLTKDRLHNLYLHGSGVVCGLQVSCSKCDGAVTVQSGYAIDPCGNDIIVCNAQDFNVIQRIHECEKERKKMRCDPLAPPQQENCQDLERHYCLTIAYRERETRLSPTLSQGSATNASHGKGCTCGCQSNGKKNGCGPTSSSSSTSSQSTYALSQTMSTAGMTASSSSTMPVSCQPTRILEEYLLDVIEVPPSYCTDARELLEDTLLEKVIECVTSLRGFFDKQLPRNAYEALIPLAFTGKIDEHTSLDELYRSCCYLRQAIHELYKCDPLNTHCQTLDVLCEVCCEPPPQVNLDNEQAAVQTRTAYIEQARATLYNLLALLMQYVLDCVCQALLPPCPCAENDDRLILACMTVKKDEIIDICNFCHRRYAGSFPALYYWLSLVPVIPLLAYAVERLCCYDWLSLELPQRQGERRETAFRGHLVNGLTSLLNSIDPSGSLRSTIFADNFAMPKRYAERFEQLINKVSSPAKIAETLQSGGFNLSTIIGRPDAELNEVKSGVEALKSDLAKAAQSTALEAVRNDVEALKANVASAAPSADLEVVRNDVEALKANVASAAPSADLEAVRNDVEALKGNMTNAAPAADVSQLRGDIEALKGNVAGAAQSSSLDEVKNDVETLKGNLANVAQASDVSQIRGDLDALRNVFANVPQTAEVSQIRSEIETLRNDLANVPPSSTIDAIRNDIDALHNSLASVPAATEVSQIRADVEALKNDLTNVPQASDVNQVKTDVEALKNNLANVPQASDVNQVKTDVEALKNNLANVPQASDVNQVKTDVDTLKNNLANVAQASDVNQVKTDVDTLKNNLANVAQASDVSQIRSDLDALRNDFANVPQTAEVSQIRTDVEALKNDLANAPQATDVNQIKNDVEALRNDLAKVAQPPVPSQEISDLQATIKALQDELAALRNEVDQLKPRDTGSPGETGGTPPAEPPQQ